MSKSLRSGFAVRLFPCVLAWLPAAMAVLPLRAHHADFITVTADFRTDRPAWTVTVSMDALKVLEETQSTALADELRRNGATPGPAQAEFFRAAGHYLGERLSFAVEAPRGAIVPDYQFSVIGVPDDASGRTELVVVGRHDGDLPAAARRVEVELRGALRAMLIRKVDGAITGPALTLQPAAGKPAMLDVPALASRTVPAANPDAPSGHAITGIAVAVGLALAAGGIVAAAWMRRRRR